MRLKTKILKCIEGTLLFAAFIFSGGKVAEQFKTFDSNYWRQEIKEEKDKRIDLLDKISNLGNDGLYSKEDLALLHDGLLASTMLFNYMDCDEGDVAAYDSPISPGDLIIGDMNVKYASRFDTPRIRATLANLRHKYDLGNPICLKDSDLDERVNGTIEEIKGVFTDPTLHKQDLRNAGFRTYQRKWMIGGLAGLALGCLVFASFNSSYKEREQS